MRSAYSIVTVSPLLPEIYVQSSEKPVVPLMYLDSYYERYHNGETMDDLLG